MEEKKAIQQGSPFKITKDAELQIKWGLPDLPIGGHGQKLLNETTAQLQTGGRDYRN